MEYLAKKINMVDILGMLIPGGLMLLILEQDIKCLTFLTKALGGAGADTLIWCIAFLCGSYLAGMLLHELGSVIEKLLWACPLTSPRAYAAIATGMLNEYPNKNDKNSVKSSYNCIWQNFFQMIFSVLAVLLVAVFICLGVGCSELWHLGSEFLASL